MRTSTLPAPRQAVLPLRQLGRKVITRMRGVVSGRASGSSVGGVPVVPARSARARRRAAVWEAFGLAAALGAGLFDRGRLFRFGEGAAGQGAQCGGLPLHRFRDRRVGAAGGTAA
ncbi:hypothetical protein [Streptomyces sp. SID8352]|uniref:hypothetical protein n=1 Tax=Streptomyces sp. SID8352 TaxID=2690338 RepID=UPI00136B492F|nr:hypothetical protein [Streptomyces sp. SID8352]MYU21268.1 hypothetical protein [Streptomyces sp. SID8352]